jgi:protease-4
MKQFFKFMFASMLGIFLSIALVIVIFTVSIFSAVSNASKEKEIFISPNSILHLTLDQPISERGSSNPFANLDFKLFSASNQLGLDEILENIKKAKNDDNIRGIYLDVTTIPSGIATIEEVRNALIDFKTSHKFIYAYSEIYSQSAYYMASVADKIFMNPSGELDFKGLKAEVMFYKGTLDKLEVEPEIIRHGKFKSAIEPYILDKMSTANREQISAFLGSIWKYLITSISSSRNISVEQVQNIADNMLVREAEDAVKQKMVDQLVYKDEFYDVLKHKIGIDKSSKINFISLKKYSHVKDGIKKIFITDKIAIIYAAGEIQGGEGDDNTIGSEGISEAIRKARLDNTIKAIVLRVNSPGGSALASDVIWREVVLAKKAKPVVVSMGDVAASGGYYISCGADYIVAQPNTITGSIGVFGLMFNAQKLFNNKLGITVDTFKTARYADIGSTYRPLTASERNIMQLGVEKVYDQFITKVAEGRKLKKANVDSIGQGRVWSAIDAKKIGLVDELGGIQVAVNKAAELAKIGKYRITKLPEQKETLDKIMEQLSDNMQSSIIKNELGDIYKPYAHLKSMINIKGVQARMPFDIDIY